MKLGVLAFVAAAGALAFADSPVKGRMSRPLLVCGGGRAFLVTPEGRVAWNRSGCGNIHRVWPHGGWVYYSNGDLWRTEIATGRTELFYKPCEKEGLFGFEILPNGNVVVAENGTDHVTELKAGTAEPVVRFKADPTGADGKMPGAHGHFRMIRKTPQGTYLLCCSSANVVREYDKTGRLVWEQPAPVCPSGHAPLAFDALRRANGNTVISHLGAITEFTPDHRAVWQFTGEDAPELKLDNLCGIWEQKNGNLVVGTYANGAEDGSRTTAFEVTRDKKIVWSYAAAGKRFSMMTAIPVEPAQWPIACTEIPAGDEAALAARLPPALPAKPKKSRRALMLACAFGYSHNDALAYGRRAFELAARKSGAFALDVGTDVAVLGDAAALAKYDAVILNNCTAISVKRHPAIERTLVDYVRSGGGLCLIHAAADSFYDSPAVQDMMGGLFRGHPWTAGGSWRFRNEEPDHPLVAAFRGKGPVFRTSDEIYQQASPPYSRDKVRVLVSLDVSDAATARAAEGHGAGAIRADRDFAVSWTRPFGAGRVFYTSFGHDRRAFLDPARLGHMLAGLQYCLGDLDCPDAPRK
ncbi:MAG: ThuA domain-containing protein [Kiritimatiellia bacterium]